MLLALLLGCGPGTFETEDGKEPLRAALYFAPDSTLTLAAQGTRQIYVLLANSTLPCEPEAVEDDPRTENSDEVAAAKDYWEAQFATAFLREGALVVAGVLAIGADEDWLGRYPLQSDAWDAPAMAAYVEETGRVAAGGWYRVDEASSAGASGVLYANDDGGFSVDEEAHDLSVGAPAWVEVTEKNSVLAGAFDFPDAKLAGTFTAARCDNADLLTELYKRVGALVVAEQLEGGDDDTLADTGTVPPSGG